MLRFFFIGIATLFISIPAQLDAQEFPYVAPSAPEFDGRGNLLREASRPNPRLSSNPQSTVPSKAPVRLEAPTSINSTGASSSSPPKPVVAPQIPGYGGPQDSTSRPPRQASFPQYPDSRQTATGSAPLASKPTQSLPKPAQGVDCSQFPMLIANSRSEAEMQVTARRYLTCLIQNGWNMDQARQHVISTIESTYRLAR